MTSGGGMKRQTALDIFHNILLIRRCEERICKEYPSDEMKTPVHLCVGAEGIEAACLAAFPRETRYFGTYRNHGLYLGLTRDLNGFFAELYGKGSGCAQGRAGSMHLSAPDKGLILTSAVVATTIPVAVGSALADQYRGTSGLSAVFFGDGAVEEGAFWESLNFASLKKLRVLFVCEDNELAINTGARDRQGFKSIGESVKGFRCHSTSIEGYDPAVVYKTVMDLLKKMDEDPAPAFLHAGYFRYLEHVGICEDFAAGYRERPEADKFAMMDPLKKAEENALGAGVSEKEIRALSEKVDNEINAAIEYAKKAPFPGADALYSS